MTIEEYQQHVASLPKASHNMEHITNFGQIVSGGFILLASTLERAIEQISFDPATREAQLAAQRTAKRQALEAELAALGGASSDAKA